MCAGLEMERRVLMLKNGEGEEVLLGGSVVRIVVGQGVLGGRLKARGERRCGDVKRVTWRVT